MNLGFSQEINGKPSVFIQKIWSSIILNNLDGINKIQYHAYANLYKSYFGKTWDSFLKEVNPKLHTIRSGKRWKTGNLIHFTVDTGSTICFQFAPVLPCRSVQDIEIKYLLPQKKIPIIYIEGKEIQLLKNYDNILQQLVINDGFDSVNSFFTYFDTDFTGQLVHWTDLGY